MEKTFDDLLKPHQKRFDYYNSQRIYIDKADVLKLLQQVREATIAECRKIALYEDDSVLIWDHIKKMPNNSIKTDL